MSAPSAADAGKVFRLRSMLGALVLVACLYAPAPAGATTASPGVSAGAATTFPGVSAGAATTFAGISGAPATPAVRATTAHAKTGRPDRRHGRRAVRCAKRSSFHSRGGHVRRKHHPHHSPRCSKRHTGKRHLSGRHGGGSHHSGGGRRTGHRTGKHWSKTVKPADAGNTCPGAGERPTQENIEVIRAATLCLIDQERTGHGEAPLQPNGQLRQAAQAHTESMAFGAYFEHDGPRGDTPLSRMTASGYIYSSHVGYEIGENIGWGTLSLATPRAIVVAWMASPGHRANILDAHFRDTAIGVSPDLPSSLGQSQAGAIYTQDFGVIITG
jgi:uncharacterized protein YkwD